MGKKFFFLGGVQKFLSTKENVGRIQCVILNISEQKILGRKLAKKLGIKLAKKSGRKLGGNWEENWGIFFVPRSANT